MLGIAVVVANTFKSNPVLMNCRSDTCDDFAITPVGKTYI